MTINEKLRKLGMTTPEILLPKEGTDLTKWTVIACDQYTSEKEYWEKAADFTSGVPSTLNLIFPECFLADEGGDQRIASITNAMNSYIQGDVFGPPINGFILVKRDAPGVETRWGLMTALDLDAYDFTPESASLIRATEGTILDRIPPRKRVRKDAPLELPHIMVLLDDPDGFVVEAAREKALASQKPVYDFDLMFDAGHLTGYGITQEDQLSSLADGLTALWERQVDKTPDGKSPLLYAVGDGNHSLATAKSIWEDIKPTLSDAERENHPSRFALIELVNLYDAGITFEPIHRILFETDGKKALEDMITALGSFTSMDSETAVSQAVKSAPGSAPVVGVSYGNIQGIITLKDKKSLPTGQVQDWIDPYITAGGAGEVDYIHGDDSTFALSRKEKCFGILLPAIGKDSFFDVIVDQGAYPRKTFSMGEAHEKRFYLEARKIL